jgi:flagellar hook-basal body protein
MLKSLYTTATGMKAQQTMVDMIANNIANVNTAGFKKSQASFEDLFYVTLQSPGLARGAGGAVPIGTQIGSGTRLNGTTKVFTTGTLEITERNLDVAIDGDGFFAVTLPDGNTGYTRDGGFHLNADGKIVTGSGNVLQPEITVPNDALEIAIDPGRVDAARSGHAAPLRQPERHARGRRQRAAPDRGVRPADHEQPGPDRSRSAEAGLRRAFQRPDRQRTGQPDRRAARLRGEQSRDPGQRPDAVDGHQPVALSDVNERIPRGEEEGA